MKPFHKMKKKPLHAEDVAEELRKRVQFGRLTFREAEIASLTYWTNSPIAVPNPIRWLAS